MPNEQAGLISKISGQTEQTFSNSDFYSGIPEKNIQEFYETLCKLSGCSLCPKNQLKEFYRLRKIQEDDYQHLKELEQKYIFN